MRIDRRGNFHGRRIARITWFARTPRIVTLVILRGYLAGVLRFNAAPVVSTKFYAPVYYRADVRYFLLGVVCLFTLGETEHALRLLENESE